MTTTGTTFLAPTTAVWNELLDTPNTRWFTDQRAHWMSVRRCRCGAPSVAFLTWQTDEVNTAGDIVDRRDHQQTVCGGCLPDDLRYAAGIGLLAGPLCDDSVVEIEVDADWLRLCDVSAEVVARFGTGEMGCGL